jgi:hypothetical protein
MFRRRQETNDPDVPAPDLHTQFEALLDTVWRCEHRADINDRIDAQARLDSLQPKRWRKHR